MTTTLPAAKGTTGQQQAYEARKSRHTFPRDARVYSYRRISSGGQRKGRGQQRQDDNAVNWCKANGLTLEPANCFSDVISGFKKRNNAEHGELRTILKLIEDGKMERGSILLLENLDRLSRQNINIALGILLQIVNSGVVVVTPMTDEVIHDQLSPQELMAALMMALVTLMRANEESRTKSERKKYSWSKKRELAIKGAYHGGNLPRWIEVGPDGKYRVIESEAKVVRDAFNDYVNGLGLYRLSAKYGIAKPTIAYWLDSAVVTGTLTMKEGGQRVSVPNHYPAIIDRQTFEQAQQRRVTRYVKRQKGRTDKFVNLFAGLLRDPNGKPMIVCQHNGGVRNYTSPGHVIRVAYLEEVVVCHRLEGCFVRVHESQERESADPQSLAKVEADIKQIKATMMEEPGLAVTLLPVVRKLEQQRRELAGASKVVSQKVDVSLPRDLLNGGTDDRQKLRDIVQQTVRSIRITKVESENWYQHVYGVVTLVDDIAYEFSYAYNTRRNGFIVTDNRPNFFFFYTDEDDLKTQLNKFPLRKRPK